MDGSKKSKVGRLEAKYEEFHGWERVTGVS